jgi:hypothetical protein
MSPTLGIITDSINDGLSIWRAAGPLFHKSFRSHCNVRHVSGQFGWAEASQCDALFFHRPHSQVHYEAMLGCRRMGIPVWCDWDDDLFHVPEGNPAGPLYDAPARARICHMAEMADACTFSTDRLMQVFAKKTVGAQHGRWCVIENAFDPRMFPIPPAAYRKKPGVVLWRGSATHSRDLDVFRADVEEICARWQVEWVGFKPWWASGRLHAERSPLRYFDLLQTLSPAVVFTPLELTPFNMSKSDIAALEATAIGAVCVTNAPWLFAEQCLSGEFADHIARALEMNGPTVFACKHYLESRHIKEMNTLRLSVLGSFFA